MKYLALAGYGLLLCACCGWGHALARWTARQEKHDFALLAVAGIGVLVFLGGLLNLVRLAVPVALDVLLVAGLLFFFAWYAPKIKLWLVTGRSARHDDSSIGPGRAAGFLPLVLLLLAAGFYAWTLLPAAAFNINDDYYTYIPRPLRMLQTGTLAGNPYDMLGLDSLGANAFLQAFVLLGLPFQFLQGFEAVFSYLLGGLLLLALSRRFGIHWVPSTFALLAFIAINPQAVNISAVYACAAILLGIFFASCLLLERSGEPGAEAIPKLPIAMLGLLFAGLAALKVTFVLYALAYFSVLFIGMLSTSHDRRRTLKHGGLIVLLALVAILPWLLLNSGNYIAAIQLALHAQAAAEHALPVSNGHVGALLSTADLYYGDSFLSYGSIVLELAAVGCFSLYRVISGRLEQGQRGFHLVTLAACAAAITSYFANGMLFAPEDAIRYSCPLLIASFTFSLLAVSRMLAGATARATTSALAGANRLAVPALALLVIVQFWDHLLVRAGRAYDEHQSIAFALNPEYLTYNRFVISPESTRVMRGLQDMTEPGQKILAWVSMPLRLDFARNEIYSVMSPGLLSPWLDLPLNGSVPDLVRYLKSQGIRYILWEYNGYGMSTEDKFRQMLSYPSPVLRKIGQRSLYLRQMLEAVMSGGRFLYYSDNVALFDLQQIN